MAMAMQMGNEERRQEGSYRTERDLGRLRVSPRRRDRDKDKDKGYKPGEILRSGDQVCIMPFSTVCAYFVMDMGAIHI